MYWQPHSLKIAGLADSPCVYMRFFLLKENNMYLIVCYLCTTKSSVWKFIINTKKILQNFKIVLRNNSKD